MVKNIPLGHERRRLRLAGNGRVGKAGNAPYRANLFIGRRRRYSPRGRRRGAAWSIPLRLWRVHWSTVGGNYHALSALPGIPLR